MTRVEYKCVTFPLRAVAYPLLCIKCGSPPILTPLLGTYSISLPKGCQGRCHSIWNSSSHPNSTIQGWIFKSRFKETVSRGGLRIQSTTFLSISISKVWCAKDPSSHYPSSRETRTTFRSIRILNGLSRGGQCIRLHTDFIGETVEPRARSRTFTQVVVISSVSARTPQL